MPPADLLRKYPGSYEKFLPMLARHLSAFDAPDAKARPPHPLVLKHEEGGTLAEWAWLSGYPRLTVGGITVVATKTPTSIWALSGCTAQHAVLCSAVSVL